MTTTTLPDPVRERSATSSQHFDDMTPPPPRRHWKRWVVLTAVIGAVAALTYVYRGPKLGAEAIETYEVARRSFPIKLNEKGELKAKNSVTVRCELEGRSTIVWLIPEGQEVKKGDLLVRLSSNEIDEKVQAERIKAQNAEAAAEAADKELDILLDQNASNIRQAKLNLHNAEVELDIFMLGDSVQTRTDLIQAQDRAEKVKAQREAIVADSKKLWEEKFLSKREYDQHVLDFDEAKVNLEKANLALEIFEKYTFDKDKGQKESDVAEAEKELERTVKKAEAEEAKQRANTAAKHSEFKLVQERLTKYLDQQKKTEMVAPADGLVVYDTGENRWMRREVREGAEVFERQGIISLPDVSVMQVSLRIHESKTNKIAVGQRAYIEVEGLPGVVLEGKVETIAPLADSQNGWLNPDLKEYDATVTIESNKYPLKPGVTARAEIMVDDVHEVVAVPVQAVYSSGPAAFVFVGDSQKDAEPRKIETGRSNDEYVEIVSGLKPGERVLLASSDTMIARLPAPPDNGRSASGKPKGEPGAPADAAGSGAAEGKPRRGNGKAKPAAHKSDAQAPAAQESATQEAGVQKAGDAEETKTELATNDESKGEVDADTTEVTAETDAADAKPQADPKPTQ